MKNQSYIEGRRIKSVSKMPDIFLWLLGLIDSLRPTEVAQAHLQKYMDILSKNEKDEALLAEQQLYKSREQGGRSLYTIVHSDVGAPPEKPAPESPAAAKRTYERELSRYHSDVAAVKNAKFALSGIDAAITSGNLVFEERLEKTRNKGMRKIDAYIKGVRSGKQFDFAPDCSPDDTAREKYFSAHINLDDMIHAYVREEM